jgi:hypothetical protein
VTTCLSLRGKAGLGANNRIIAKVKVRVGNPRRSHPLFSAWLYAGDGEICPRKGSESGEGSWIATDAEALAYVSNASLTMPLASDWVETYGAGLLAFSRDSLPFLFGFFAFCLFHPGQNPKWNPK